MSTATVVAIIAAVAVVVVLAIAAGPAVRRQRLRRRFGSEYDRLVGQRQSRRLAEEELAERERRVRGLRLRDLTDSERDRRLAEWAEVQERFVDSPADSIAAAERLVGAVMRERGYPASEPAEFEQMVADLSVRHARRLGRFRSARDLGAKAASGDATTEELRVALLDCRALLGDLVGRSLEPGTVNRSQHGGALLRIR